MQIGNFGIEKVPIITVDQESGTCTLKLIFQVLIKEFQRIIIGTPYFLPLPSQRTSKLIILPQVIVVSFFVLLSSFLDPASNNVVFTELKSTYTIYI